MNIISNEIALAAITDPALCAILERFADMMDLATLYIVEAGDTLASIEQACGCPLEGWEYVLRHPSQWFELVIIQSDFGEGFVVLVPDQADIDPEVLTMCRANATKPDGMTDC